MKKKNYTERNYELVKLYFKYNKNQHTSGEKLKQLFGLNTISLQGIIHDLRTEMTPIISCGKNGYKFTTNKDEIMKTYMSLTERAKSILVAANGLKEYLEKN